MEMKVTFLLFIVKILWLHEKQSAAFTITRHLSHQKPKSISHHVSERLDMKMSSTKKSDLIVGLNKYSHDASCCIIEASTGKILFSQAKERITRKKHDGGQTGDLVEYALEYLGASISDIAVVVSNNHHYRVLSFEKRLPFASALNYVPSDYLKESNLLPNAKHFELSHHLAHAYSVAGTCPFTDGLIVCMDGMGESYRAMMEDLYEGDGTSYMHDIRLLKSLPEGDLTKFVGIPRSLVPGAGYREAESAYVIEGSPRQIKPVFKRWSRERSPSELCNHGFENMESLGAVYSRVSSQILGDWNACGKIMGLAPWNGIKRQQLSDWCKGNRNIKSDSISIGEDFYHKIPTMSGNPFIDPAASANSDDGFKVNWDKLENLAHVNQWSDKKFDYYANLATSVQSDLEASAIKLLTSLKEQTGKTNVALVGGVALNSVLNGRFTREAGFETVYVPSAPGDEGICVGCAVYGLQKYREGLTDSSTSQSGTASTTTTTSTTTTSTASTIRTVGVPLASETQMTAYTGRAFSDELIELSLFEQSPWLADVTKHDSPEAVVTAASATLAEGKTIAWFQGRSEFGQRALGSRSIMADPRSNSVRHLINDVVKEREWYRPLAPAVLEDNAKDWFELDNLISDSNTDAGANVSPYMSLTTQVKAEKTSIVPAICHIDNSARLQTVSKTDNSLFYSLIEAFFKLTGVPMVLNTSFNRKSEPIVESPTDAINSFLASKGSIDKLFIGSFEVSFKKFSVSEFLLNENMLVFAQPIYLAEVTTIPGQESVPVRVRIQDGESNVSEGSDSWRVLPSPLHLEILQLLQVQPSLSPSDGSDTDDQSLTQSSEEQPGVLVSELKEILFEATSDSEIVESEKEWGVRFSDAVAWLYEHRLLYFEESSS